MKISRAGTADVTGLARLLWADTGESEQQNVEAFTDELSSWWAAHQDSHSAFVARLDAPAPNAPALDASEIIGMAWVALVPRVPRPGATSRLSADIQSVFVVPEHRGRGIGSALVSAASEHAVRLGALRVSVHSSRGAVPLYERIGFESSRQLLQKPAD